jgi:cytochrome c oxidase assembly factor CtaG/putative copper export protein
MAVGGAVAAAVAVVGGLSLTGAAGPTALADPGVTVRWLLPAVRLVSDVAASLTIGLLLFAATVLPGRDGGGKSGLIATSVRPFVRRAAGIGAVWAASTAAVAGLTFAKISGLAPTTADFGAEFASYAWSLAPIRMLLLTASLAALVAAIAAVALRRPTVGWLVGLALAALIPLALTGHAAGSSDHELAVDSLAAHLISAGVWVGGLIALVLMRRRLGPDLATVASRYSTLALWSWFVIGISGLINAWLRVGQWSALGTTYGLLIAVKSGALILAGVAGWVHRRLTLRRLHAAAGEHECARLAAGRLFWRLVGGEIVVLAAAMGTAVALAASRPPTAIGSTTGLLTAAIESPTGYPVPEPLTAAAWVQTWRVDLFWCALALIMVGTYAMGMFRLRQRGDHWPLWRGAVWCGGWLIVVWATSGAAGVYGRVLFGAHMVGHMTVSMVVPPLLVLAAPVTLAMRAVPKRRDGSWGPREWLLALVHSRFLAALSQPLVAPTLFISSLIVFYYTPLFELSLSTHTGHVLMHIHFLLTGYLFSSVLIGVDPGPARPAYPLRLVLLFATMAFHAFFGIALVSGTRLLAPTVMGVGRLWGDTPIVDQQYGGAVAWGIGEVPVLVMAWVRSDERQARRSDRQADRDGGSELAAYNQRLATMAQRRD